MHSLLKKLDKRADLYVVGICGGSSSGKTTIVNSMLKIIGRRNACVIQHDWYYKDKSYLDINKRQHLNYDSPTALDNKLFASQVKSLIDGNKIYAPIYDYYKHCRKDGTNLIRPKKLIFIEGILIFKDEQIARLLDLKIFIDVPPDIRLSRRINRDLVERGRSGDSVITQYFSKVEPMHIKYVEPFKNIADLVVDNKGDGVNLSSRQILDFIKGKIRNK